MSFVLADVDRFYEEDPLLTRADVDVLSQWLKAHPHLPHLTELQLVLFLHSCHYDNEAAKTTIINYYTLKTGSELFKSADEDLIRRTLATVALVVLPHRTPEGYSVLFTKLLDDRLENFDFANIMKLLFMVMNLYFHQNGPTNGFLIVADVGITSFGHLFKFNLSVVRQTIHFLQEAASIRFKGLHYVNVAPVTKHLMALARPFLKKEVYECMRVHPNSIASLYEFIPKKCLPRELGGSLPSYFELNGENIKNIVNHLEFFKWHDGQDIDESLRQDRAGGLFRRFFRKS